MRPSYIGLDFTGPYLWKLPDTVYHVKILMLMCFFGPLECVTRPLNLPGFLLSSLLSIRYKFAMIEVF